MNWFQKENRQRARKPSVQGAFCFQSPWTGRAAEAGLGGTVSRVPSVSGAASASRSQGDGRLFPDPAFFGSLGATLRERQSQGLRTRARFRDQAGLAHRGGPGVPASRGWGWGAARACAERAAPGVASPRVAAGCPARTRQLDARPDCWLRVPGPPEVKATLADSQPSRATLYQ